MPVLVVIVLRRYLCQCCKATMTVGPLGLLTRRLFSAAALGLALCLWGMLKETALRVHQQVNPWPAAAEVGEAAELLVGLTPTQRRLFVRVYKGVLRRGAVEELVAAIDEFCVGRNAKALETERDYFARNAERMRYADFEQRGLPLGSGAVESAVRQVVNQRLKSNGMFWLQTRAEHMLHLRAFLRAGRWDQLVLSTLAHHCSLTAQALA